MFNLEGTPYLLEGRAIEQVKKRLDSIEERVSLLRRNGTLTEQTVKDYYGEKRFEQVAESNAIEGSTLSAGETELAVLKGITITGHDPAYAKDAMALDRALTRITELARDVKHPTNIKILDPVGGNAIFRLYDSPLDLDDYLEACSGHSVSKSWAFSIRIEIPGLSHFEKLAYIGHRSDRMFNSMNREGGPSLYWSSKNPATFPKWLSDDENSPFAMEVTSKAGFGDEWTARLPDHSIQKFLTTDLAARIADALIGQVNV